MNNEYCCYNNKIANILDMEHNYFKNTFGKYQYDKFIELFSNNEKYTRLTNAEQMTVHNFLCDLHKDLNIPTYKLDDIVKQLLSEKSKYISYYSIINDAYKYSNLERITNDLEKLEALLVKYNGVNIELPFEVSESEKKYKFRLPEYIYNNITRIGIERNTITNDTIKILKIVIKHLSKRTSKLISNSNNMRCANSLNVEELIKDDFNIEETKKKYDSEDLVLLKIFQLLIENNVYDIDKFPKLLSFLYFRGDLTRLEIIKRFRPELLTINLSQLIKIIFYGRYKVLQFILNNIPDQFQQLVQAHNPYDITLLKDSRIHYVHDIWDGLSWHNDEHEKPYIGTNKFDKVSELMKENSNCIFSNEHIKSWLQIVSDCEEYSQESHYFVDKNKLISMLNLDSNTKNGIKQLVDAIGLDATWNIIKEKESDVLALLLE